MENGGEEGCSEVVVVTELDDDELLFVRFGGRGGGSREAGGCWRSWRWLK